MSSIRKVWIPKRKTCSEAKEDLEDLEEELEEIENLKKDKLEDYDFDSKEEYEERLDDLDDDIYFLKLDIEMIEKYLNKKRSKTEKNFQSCGE